MRLTTRIKACSLDWHPNAAGGGTPMTIQLGSGAVADSVGTRALHASVAPTRMLTTRALSLCSLHARMPRQCCGAPRTRRLLLQKDMLEDHKRTGAYHQAILNNRACFEGKVVLDVGTGSGILAIFAARAGARKVYAVEATNMAKLARQLVAHNDVRSDTGRLTFVHAQGDVQLDRCAAWRTAQLCCCLLSCARLLHCARMHRNAVAYAACRSVLLCSGTCPAVPAAHQHQPLALAGP